MLFELKSPYRTRRIPTAFAMASAAFLFTAAQAPAEVTPTEFTPKAAVLADTTQAGAHPNVTLTMSKTPNHCPAIVAFGSCGIFKPTGWPIVPVIWNTVPLHLEQDLKRWIVRFPEGLMADPQAAPQCNDPQKGGVDVQFQYQCPAESQVGVLTGKTRNCTPTFCSNEDSIKIGGAIYNGAPEPGEQGHLYTLLGAMSADGKFSQWIRVDTSIRIDPQTFRIEATTDNIPDFLEYPGGAIVPIQPYDLTMKLWGNIGAEKGHPLLTNATFCEPRSLDSTFQGYANFAYGDDEGQVHTGTGEGEPVTTATDYPVTGCEALPYEPKLSMALSDTAPDAVPAIETTIEQKDGQQTTKRAVLKIPGVFKINTATTVAPCKAEELAADACAESSQIGSAEAHSKLLPSGPLAGKVTMGAPDGGAFPLRASLKGFVDVAIQGSVGIDQGGGIVATFDNLPPVPISAFSMHLDGGKERGMVVNPTRCGKTSAVEATFTSHAGREVIREVPLRIACGGVNFSVALARLRNGRLPRLKLATTATGIDRISYSLPAALAQLTAKLGKGKALGSASMKLAKGTKQAKLVLASKRGRTLKLVAKAGAAHIAHLSLKKPRTIASKKHNGHSRRRAKRYRGALQLTFDSLPADTVSLGLELGGGKSNESRSAIPCGKSLAFSMQATDPDGASHAVTRKVKTKCAKHRPKRHGRRGKQRRGR